MKLYKDRNINLYTLDIIANKRLYLTKATHINDPYEVLLKTHLKTENIRDHGKEYLNAVKEKIDNIKFCALSEEYEHALLWAHYADSFRGIAIEIEIDERSEDLKKVEYHTAEEILNFSKALKDKIERKTVTNADWVKYYIQKVKDWEYENECRIVKEGVNDYVAIKINKILIGDNYLENGITELLLLKKILEIDKEIPISVSKIDLDGLWWANATSEDKGYPINSYNIESLKKENCQEHKKFFIKRIDDKIQEKSEIKCIEEV